MPSMKNMGPACCCCHDVWSGESRSHLQIGKPASLAWSATGTAAGNGDFDHVNRKALYANRSGTNDSVYLHDEKLNTEAFVITRPFTNNEFAPLWLGCCDPDNERIVDITHKTAGVGEDEIVAHLYNYDGTGDTQLMTLPVWDAPNYYSRISHVHYNRITDTVFCWIHRGNGTFAGDLSVTQTYFEILEFDLLGNPPTVIHSFAAKRWSVIGNQYLGQVFVLDIDYTNQKLWWEIHGPTTDGAATYDRQIQRSDWNGANLETLLTEQTSSKPYTHAGWQYSHSDNKFYLSAYNTSLSITADTATGFWQVEPDWLSKKLLYSRADLEIQPTWFRLGCGYETLGPGSIA